jgi:hypothetical protein
MVESAPACGDTAGHPVGGYPGTYGTRVMIDLSHKRYFGVAEIYGRLVGLGHL